MDRPSHHPPIDFAARRDASATCSSAAAGRGGVGDAGWVGDGNFYEFFAEEMRVEHGDLLGITLW